MVIQLLSDRDLELKSRCKGLQGLNELRSGVEAGGVRER
jgi:hypothetical protein